jgi:small subunit ribosomal protein S24e
VDVLHPGKANVAKSELAEQLAKTHKSEVSNVVLFGFSTQFGGGKSTGFCLIYNDAKSMVKFEPKHRLIKAGLKEKVETSRKQIKESKNRGKKTRGTGRAQAKHKQKRSGGD